MTFLYVIKRTLIDQTQYATLHIVILPLFLQGKSKETVQYKSC